MPAKNPDRERSFAKKGGSNPFKDMINNSKDAQRQKLLIENETDTRYQVQSINVEDIVLNEKNDVFNMDDTDEEIQALAESISAYGLITPVSVVKTDSNKYLMLSGERRTKAHILLNERKIKAFVYNSLEDYKQQGILYHANLLSRTLDDKKKFFAFKQLREYYSTLDKKMKKSEIESEISKLLGMATRSVQRYERILKNANDNDLFLLEQGELSFDEFKKRTYELIAIQSKEQDERKNILAQGAKEVKYIDKKTDTVYFVDIDNNDGENTFCTFLTNSSMKKVGFHTPALPHRKTRERAQVDLDIVAANNLWEKYDGDFSEYSQSIDTVHRNEVPTINTSSAQPAVPIKPDIKEGNSEVSYDEPVPPQNDNYKIEVSAESNNDTDNTEIDVKSQSAVNTNQNNNEISTLIEGTAAAETVIEDTEPLNHEISTYIGYSANSNQKIDGPLWIAPSGKTYILRSLTITKEIGNGKAEVICVAEEAIPTSIQRIDI